MPRQSDNCRTASVTADNAHPSENSEVTLAETASWLQQFSTRSGTITRRTTNEAFGVTEWELSNGVTVVLKPTAFRGRRDCVSRVRAREARLLARDQDYPRRQGCHCISCRPVALADSDAADLAKVPGGQGRFPSRFISEMDEGLTGSASRKELETMFQLIQPGRSLQPRADAAALGAVLSGPGGATTLTVRGLRACDARHACPGSRARSLAHHRDDPPG